MILIVSAEAECEDKKWQRPTIQREFPKGQDFTINGENLRCFRFSEGQVMKHIEIDYKGLFNAAISWESLRLGLELKVSGLELRLSAHRDMVKELSRNNEWWKSLFDKEHEYRLKLEMKMSQKDKFGWVPWAMMAVESIVIGVIGSVALIKQ
jgi:hypothetical protein